ncbi:snurportin-1 [Monomorium pharaonis]|uniref:snurportin-1 n=1 Tax=Monomorium pharaonis TaxID=307658 RepID=UPI00063F7BE8|nr:snurportin-1 [Monomorium pharaonis]
MAEYLSDNINDKKNDNESDDKSENISYNISDNTTKYDTKETDCDTRETVRRQFYKNRIKKYNIKLETDDSTPQEERRRLLLEHQKKFREKTINAARGIFPQYSVSENEECVEEEFMDTECMEYANAECVKYTNKKHMGEKTKKCASQYYRIIPNQSRTYRMMLSEWMLDVPQDFIDNWIMVPCPTGHRVRLISGRGETRSYSRRGILYSVFPSALPGGNFDSDMRHSAAIDGIWVKSRKVFYVLDILYWTTLPFTNCEAEFRLFWLKNKLLETSDFKECTDTNKYPILTLPNINCNSDFNSALRNLDGELHPLDGFLFYHRNALYTYGYTPLVTWLKPFMLSEVLGISVPAPLDEKPDDYISFEHHVQKHKIKTKKNDKTEFVTNAMEIEGVI